MNKRKEIHSYVRPSRIPYIVGALLFGVFFLVGFRNMDLAGLIIICLFFLGIICGPTGFREISIHKALQREANQDTLDELYDDFSTGTQIGGDSVRIGTNYVIGRRCGYCKISSIKQVYQYIHKTNFAEDDRMLRAKLYDGSTVNLMKLGLKGTGDGELLQAVSLIEKINPRVQIGYK